MKQTFGIKFLMEIATPKHFLPVFLLCILDGVGKKTTVIAIAVVGTIAETTGNKKKMLM